MPPETIKNVKRDKVGEVVQSFVEDEDPPKKEIREIKVVKKEKGKWDVTATFYG